MIGAAAGAVRRLYHSAGEVMHKHEIAARLGDKTSLPLRQPVEKNRQRTADIARPDDIGEPKRNPIDTAILHVMLARGLRDRVAAVDRVDRVVERNRLLARLCPVAQRRLKIDQPPDLIGFAGLRDIGAADAIGHGVRMPIVRVLVRCSGMDDDIRAEIADQRIDDALVDDAVLDEAQPRMRLQIVAPPGREIIDREHLVAAGEQQIDQCRADEARPTSHKNLHYENISVAVSCARCRFSVCALERGLAARQPSAAIGAISGVSRSMRR